MDHAPRPSLTESKEAQIPSFLYHMVPEDMKGDFLHPLNALRTTDPDLYAKKAAKYEGREEVMQQLIPTLDALWNDVIHLSPINPEELKQSLIEAGMQPRNMKFYKIDPSLLDPSKTTIYLFNNGDEEITAEHFAGYDPNNLIPHSTLPESTKSYYKKMFSENKKPLYFIGVPHILHKGSIDTSKLEIITV